MWAIRFLNGKLAGQEIPLQEGKYILGRSDDCQITIADPGISKKHAELEIDEQGAIIMDLQSSNGTFLNGVQIQESTIHNKDKVSLCQTTFDIVRSSKPNLAPTPFHPHSQGNTPPSYPPTLHYGSGYPPPQQHTLQPIPAMEGQTQQDMSKNAETPVKLTLKNWFKNYMDKVVLPGVYKLPVWLEFKWVIASIMIFFIVTMTSLSAIPLVQILNSSVTQESMNHAESIATTLARMNYETIKNQLHSAASVEYALRRPGVVKAFIIKAETGKIIAPAEQTHTYSKIPFVNEGRRKEGNSVKKIDSNTVAAMVPIQFYNKKTNTHRAEAYSVVIYKMGTLALGKTISLLVQTCFIALVLAVLLFFFLYKMIEYPIVSLNKQLSSALKDDSLSVQTDYDFTPLQSLTDNINSALSRISAAQELNQNRSEYDRMTEMNHLIEMIGYPTLGIDMESMKIQAASALFEEETGVSTERILNCLVQDIDDQALKLNLSNLLERVQQHPHEMASDSLEFSGVEFQLSAKGVYGKEGLAYTLISFIQMNQEQEEAG
ncbi:MAG: FHA domain-containing protein [Bdellovibrionales bacterium]|nr:FHA domain-containing protein [Bdellovibrionales bacterium]